MKKVIIITILVSLDVFISCVPITRVTITGNKKYPPLKSYQYVKTYLIEDSIANFKEIGLIEIDCRDCFSMPNINNIVEEAKVTARIYGANCMILLNDIFRNKRNPVQLPNYWFRIGIQGFEKDTI